MNTFIALFRGINVGGNNILPMKELVVILNGLGFENVKTYIQSGNAIFETKKSDPVKIRTAIAESIEKECGFKPGIVLLNTEALVRSRSDNPFIKEDEKSLHYYFLSELPKVPDLEVLKSIASNNEEFHLADQVFYLYAPSGIGRSKLAAKIEKALAVPATARNGRTVSKLIWMIGTI